MPKQSMERVATISGNLRLCRPTIGALGPAKPHFREGRADTKGPLHRKISLPAVRRFWPLTKEEIRFLT
jgi:hypothetical protein